MSLSHHICLICEDSNSKDRVTTLSARLDLPISKEQDECDFFLVQTDTRLELRQAGSCAPGPVYVDFASATLLYRRQHGGGRKEPLARAVGLKANRCPFVLDATAGLGRDAFMLANLGCRVHLLERSPIIAALLEDGLHWAGLNPKIRDIAARMTIANTDAFGLSILSPLPDVIYLDPMYPHRSKSALVKKEMRLVRTLVGDDHDACKLLIWARGFKGVRVVVKRPKDAPTLTEQKPSTVITSKNSRFDIYL